MDVDVDVEKNHIMGQKWGVFFFFGSAFSLYYLNLFRGVGFDFGSAPCGPLLASKPLFPTRQFRERPVQGERASDGRPTRTSHR